MRPGPRGSQVRHSPGAVGAVASPRALGLRCGTSSQRCKQRDGGCPQYARYRCNPRQCICVTSSVRKALVTMAWIHPIHVLGCTQGSHHTTSPLAVAPLTT